MKTDVDTATICHLRVLITSEFDLRLQTSGIFVEFQMPENRTQNIHFEVSGPELRDPAKHRSIRAVKKPRRRSKRWKARETAHARRVADVKKRK